jgi:peptidoglycan/xylan/chitin deacetylase (PgdA/CDA1 family)
MCVSPQNFEQQLAILRDASNPITLEAFVESQYSNSLPPRAVVITFDDGYIDNLQNAWPLLERYRVPATLFIATGFLGSMFWWDELARLIMETETSSTNLNLTINGQSYRWEVNKEDETRKRLLEEIYQLLLPLDEISRQQSLYQLNKWADLGAIPVDASDMRCMVESEIRQIAKGGVVTIGAHTVTHPRLTDLPTKGQQFEIDKSRDCLQQIIERPIKHFSYPNGSYNETTKKLLNQAGFTAACASYNDIAHSRTDPFTLPRFWVPDWNGEKFGRWLSHWLAA